MSVTPNCAIIDPSVSSTIECTTDCGCTTTSIWSARTPNSQCASITSRPLFISVAESIVIFRPIRQVGCLQRIVRRDALRVQTPSGRGTVRRTR